MKQIKQTLTEELNKMKYMLGYKRGMVISEQTDAEWQTKYFCVTQLPGIQSKKLADGSTMYEISTTGADGIKTYTQYYNNGLKKIGGAQGVRYSCDDPEFANVRKTSTDKVVGSDTNPAPGTSIRSRVEADIKTENLGLTWAQVKQSFGSTGQVSENQSLWKAWKGGWRPGKPVPDQFQTPTYKRNNQNAAGTTTTATTETNTQVAPLVQQNTDIKTPEQAEAAVEEAKNQAKLAKEQKKLTKEMCRIVGRAINPVLPLKQGVANQELCDTLRQCMKDGMLVRDNSAFDACKAFPETPIAPETTTQPGATTQPEATTQPGTTTQQPTAG